MTAIQANAPAAQLLRALGIPPQALFQQLNGMGAQAPLLRKLLDNFQQSAGCGGKGGMCGVPQAGLTAPPNAAGCPCQGSYARPQRIDLGASPGQSPFSQQAVQQRQSAMKLEGFLRNNPHGRQQLEMMLGGRILPDRVQDGVLRVQPFGVGNQSGGLNTPGATAAQTALGGIQNGAAQTGLPGSFGANPYQNMMVGALSNALGMGPNAGRAQPRPSLVGPFAPPIPGAQVPGTPGAPFGGAPFGGGLPLGGAPLGGGLPLGGAPIGGGLPLGGAPIGGGLPLGGAPMAGGLPLGGAPMAGAPIGGAGGAAPLGAGGKGGAPAGMAGGLGDAMNTGGLSVEDMVVMLLMQITKGFDKQIQDQANHVNQLQQKQNGGGAGGKGGAGGQQGSPSIDVESMKLKRLIDKRSQMFDMLRQVIDKYNETAKNMIGAMGR